MAGASTLRLSVIVPVLNEAGGIVRTLAALQALRTSGAEIIVVDGGSTDATRQLAAPLADQVLLAEQGRARQMNAGAHAASGAVLLFLHADTRLPQGAFDAILDGLAASPTKHGWGHFDVVIEGRPRMLRVIAAMMNRRARMTGIATGDQALFVRRADFDAVEGFPLQALMEDIEISRRLGRRTPPLCLPLKVVTSGRRWEHAGVWRTIFLMWRLRLLYALGVSADKLARDYR